MRKHFLPIAKSIIDEDTILNVIAVLRSGWITSGQQLQTFEEELSKFFNNRPVCVFSNGTTSLEAALRIANINAGDEVITTPCSWVATANVILSVGAIPVFVDIDPITRNLDLQKVSEKISKKTKAIMPVHMAGFPVDMDKLYAISKQYNLRVIEDAAQAIGATWDDERIGAIGDLVSFSFQASKNLTTAEGGCLVLNNHDEAKLATKLRLQGVVRSGFDGMEVDILGGKANLSDVHAAIGIGQLSKLETMQIKRNNLAQYYLDRFTESGLVNAGLQLPIHQTQTINKKTANKLKGRGNWHLFQVLLPPNTQTLQTRPEIMKCLHEQNIGSGVHYHPIHLFKLYRNLGFVPGMFPIAEYIGANILTLPLFSTMEYQDIDNVVDVLSATIGKANTTSSQALTPSN